MIQSPSFPWPSTVPGTSQSTIFTESLMYVRNVQSTGNTKVSKIEILSSGVYVLKREIEERAGEAEKPRCWQIWKSKPSKITRGTE